MKIYRFNGREGYEWILPVRPHTTTDLTFDATPRGADWRPITMRFLREDQGQVFDRHSDFPWLTADIMFLRDAAIEALGPALADFGELLDLSCDEARLKVFNVLEVRDVLDVERSDITFFPGSDRVMFMNSFAFRPDGLDGPVAFRVPQLRRAGAILFTDALVDEFAASGFTGIEFRLLWDSEHGSYGNRMKVTSLPGDRVL